MANTLDVLDLTGKVVGTHELPDYLQADEIHNQEIYEAVRVYLSNTRQDTAKTKTRNEVSGGGKKPFKQKGTGRARQGSTRSPQWRHGGVVFAPDGTQKHYLKQNKKQSKIALISALQLKLQEKKVVLVDKLAIEGSKTKTAIQVLKALSLQDKKLMILLNDTEQVNIAIALSNVSTVSTIDFIENINTYEVVDAEYILLDLEAIKGLEDLYA